MCKNNTTSAKLSSAQQDVDWKCIIILNSYGKGSAAHAYNIFMSRWTEPPKFITEIQATMSLNSSLNVFIITVKKFTGPRYPLLLTKISLQVKCRMFV